MIQTGIVKEISKNTAQVEIKRSSACGESCASCGLCPGQRAIVNAANTMGVHVGDTVMIDMADKRVLSAAFLVYIVPIIAIIAGYFTGEAVFGGEEYAILAGFVFFAAAFAVIICTDKRRKEKYTPRIVEIKESEHDGD